MAGPSPTVGTSAAEGQIVLDVLNRTPFHAESGGQDGDAGTLTGSGVAAEVLDVQRLIKGLLVDQVRVIG
ncbi:hypothetical protein GCM10010116_40850 [Microbispora rosea subsp. aerata]|nr:hypothetical protein GCM10010116_40850 [Microbispora rosea subsp. aerata]GIH57179.1 hypothetical protein Mro02_40930 [Microbispora rosea subsp. aerata]GLJ84751.1 hypothetical protein GCM10017588_34790 [Microbispora rosea subsp. aerata]